MLLRLGRVLALFRPAAAAGLGPGVLLVLLLLLGEQLAVQGVELGQRAGGGGGGVLPGLDLEVAGADVGVQDGELEGEVARADGEGVGVAGESVVVCAVVEEAVGFGLVGVGFGEQFLSGGGVGFVSSRSGEDALRRVREGGLGIISLLLPLG